MIDRNRYESLADALASVDDLEKVKTALIRETSIRYAMIETGESREIVTEMIDCIDSMGQEAVLELTEGEPTTLADALSRYVGTLAQSATEDETVRVIEVAGDLSALLVYPWPGVPDAEALTREIHETYVRLAPRFGVEMVPWDKLEEYQRQLALAIVNDLIARGTLSKHEQVTSADTALGIENPDDQTLIISVGGVEVATANHDEHGWAGMEAVQETAEAVHRALLAAFKESGSVVKAS